MIYETCPHCDGMEVCSFCNNTGRITRPFSSQPSDVGGPDATDLEVERLRQENASFQVALRDLLANFDFVALVLAKCASQEFPPCPARDRAASILASPSPGDASVREIADLRARLAASERRSRNLLARIFGDGGHKGDALGDEAAAKAADAEIVCLFAALRASERGAAALRAALEEAADVAFNGPPMPLGPGQHYEWKKAVEEKVQTTLASDAGKDYVPACEHGCRDIAHKFSCRHAVPGNFVPRAEMATEIDRLLENEDRLQKRAHVAGWNAAIEAAAELAWRNNAENDTDVAIRALRKPDGDT